MKKKTLKNFFSGTVEHIATKLNMQQLGLEKCNVFINHVHNKQLRLNLDANLWGFSLTSLLRLNHLSHVLADFGLCPITLDLNYIYSTALKNSNHSGFTLSFHYIALFCDSVVVLF